MEKHFGVRVELDPNGRQRQMFSSYAGMARFVYNWGLGVWNEHYETAVTLAKETGQTYEPTGYGKLLKLWSENRGSVAPWYREVSSQVPTQALIDLDRAFSAFFAGCAGGGTQGRAPTFPR